MERRTVDLGKKSAWKPKSYQQERETKEKAEKRPHSSTTNLAKRKTEKKTKRKIQKAHPEVGREPTLQAVRRKRKGNALILNINTLYSVNGRFYAVNKKMYISLREHLQKENMIFTREEYNKFVYFHFFVNIVQSIN